MRIKHKLFNDVRGDAHVAIIVVDPESRNLPEKSLLQLIAEEPESGFEQVAEGVYYQRYQ